MRKVRKNNRSDHAAIVSTVVMFLAVLVSTLIYGKKDGVACFSSAFSNAGFIGIPLVQAVLGTGAVFHISIMIVLVNLLQWTYGLYIMTGDPSKMSPKTVMKNPVVISVVIGLIIYLTGIPHFAFIDTLLSTITCVNTPLAMIVSGVYMAQSPIIEILTNRKAWMVSAVRLLVIPVLTLIVLKLLLYGSAKLKSAILIAAACPVGSNVSIFAQQVNCSFTDAAYQVCLSTLLCLFTLPAVFIISSYIL
ncbi:MAG: AEC family transporter [Bulleidia sp.]